MAQGFFVSTKTFLNTSMHRDVSNGRKIYYNSISNLGASVKAKFSSGIGVESGVRIENKKFDNDPIYYLTIPIKLLVSKYYDKASWGVGFGVFKGFSMTDGYSNDKGLLWSVDFCYHLNSRLSFFFELERYFKSQTVYGNGSGSPGNGPSGGITDYQIFTFSNGLGISYKLHK